MCRGNGARCTVKGVVDTDSDFTIMGRQASEKVATVAKLKNHDFCPGDKKAYNMMGSLSP